MTTFYPRINKEVWDETILQQKLAGLANAKKTDWITTDLSTPASSRIGRCLWKLVAKHFNWTRETFYKVNNNSTKYLLDRMWKEISNNQELIPLFTRAANNFEVITGYTVAFPDSYAAARAREVAQALAASGPLPSAPILPETTAPGAPSVAATPTEAKADGKSMSTHTTVHHVFVEQDPVVVPIFIPPSRSLFSTVPLHPVIVPAPFQPAVSRPALTVDGRQVPGGSAAAAPFRHRVFYERPEARPTTPFYQERAKYASPPPSRAPERQTASRPAERAGASAVPMRGVVASGRSSNCASGVREIPGNRR